MSEGYVNFAAQLNDYMLVYAMRKYLLREGEGFLSHTHSSQSFFLVLEFSGPTTFSYHKCPQDS